MTGLRGQAGRTAARVLARTAQTILVALIVLTGAFALLAWRLAERPLDLPFVAHRIEAASRERGLAVQVGAVRLRWAGFREGADAPLELVVLDARTLAVDRTGAVLARLDRAEARFALPPLLLGRVEPRSLSLAGLHGQFARQVDGSVTLGLPPDSPSITRATADAERAGPRAFGGAKPAWAGLVALSLHDVTVDAYDAPLGLVWRVREADVNLTRRHSGLTGGGRLQAEAGAARVTVAFEATPVTGGTRLTLHLDPVRPALLAEAASGLAALAVLDAPVEASFQAELGAGFALARASLDATIGDGTIHAGRGTAPLLGAKVHLEGTTRAADATFTLHTGPRPDGPVTTVQGTSHGQTSADGGWQAHVALTVDSLTFADLPALWPLGTGGPGARIWITQNIPNGTLSGGRLTLDLTAPHDLSTVALTAIDGAIDGRDLEVHWLRPVPPIDHADGRLTITDPDVIDIAVSRAQQAGGRHGGMTFSNGRVHLTGIAGDDQFADIEHDLAGPLPDLIAVLDHPKIKLLSKRPLPMTDPAGNIAAHVVIDHLPLRDDVQLDDLAISTKARLTGVHLGGTAAGRDIDRGNFDLSANNDGLLVSGRADIAGVPSSLRVAMDFRSGAPSEVIQDVSVSATISDTMMAAHGMDSGGMMQGEAAMDLRVRTRRDGVATLTADADLTGAALHVPGLAYSKPAGAVTTANLRLTLDDGRVTAVDTLRVEGPDLDIRANAEMVSGHASLVRFERLHLGGTEATGTVRLPARAGAPYAVSLSGPTLDASDAFRQRLGSASAKGTDGGGDSTPFTLDARFDRVLLGQGRRIEGLLAGVDHSGGTLRAAHATGTARGPRGDGAPLRVAVEPERGGRHATASVPDFGALLRALDVTDSIRGGDLALDARFDDGAPGRPLAGTVTLASFRVLDAPLVARILKAATLYGIVDLLRGPGVGFTRLVAPFRYQDDVITLHDARVVSPSLGATAEGRITLGPARLDLRGTVVPLYALNTLPGRIPLLGRLFSPERSGGLFAATYAVRGSLDDPAVSVNPASVLAPGMLRRLFEGG